MITSNKSKVHYSCSCEQCRHGRGNEYGQEIRKNNERKVRRESKQELRKAIQTNLRDYEEIDVVSRYSSPYTD